MDTRNKAAINRVIDILALRKATVKCCHVFVSAKRGYAHRPAIERRKACSVGFRYRPTTSVILSMKCLPWLTLKVLARCGLSS